MEIQELFGWLEKAFGDLPCLEDYDTWPEGDEDLYDDYARAYYDIANVYREFARRHGKLAFY